MHVMMDMSVADTGQQCIRWIDASGRCMCICIWINNMHVMMDTCQWQIQVSNVYMSVMDRCQWQKHATDRCMGSTL